MEMGKEGGSVVERKGGREAVSADEKEKGEEGEGGGGRGRRRERGERVCKRDGEGEMQ